MLLVQISVKRRPRIVSLIMQHAFLCNVSGKLKVGVLNRSAR